MIFNKVKYSNIGIVKSGKRLPKGYIVSDIKSDNKYIRVRDLNNGAINTKEVQYITDEAAKCIQRYRVKQGDIIISVVGTVGSIAEIDNNLDGAYLTENCDNLLVDESKCLKSYLKYYLLSDLGIANIVANTVGSTQPKLPIYGIENFDILLPNIETQIKIVKMLRSLDDKIKLNNEINNNLFKQQQNIFDEWFNKYNFSGSDNSYKESELGIIPKSWSIGHFDDGMLTLILKSGINKFAGKKKYIATADVNNRSINCYENISYNKKPSRANMQPIKNSIWFAKMENSIKNIIVSDYSENIINNYVFSTGFMGIECINDSLYYLWNLINSDKFLDIKNKNSTGTLMAGVSNSTIKNIKYIIPESKVLKEFNKISKEINHKIYLNDLQNEILSQLRDTLLPKLMNGKIDLDNIDI